MPFHEVIDIIRPLADLEYLAEIARLFTDENRQETMVGKPHLARNSKTIIYLDRNNTPDIWADIRQAVDEAQN